MSWLSAPGGTSGRGLFLLTLCLIALAACIPAKTPPQLNATAASGIVVSGERYDAGIFHVHFPSGWRSITSPAGAPVSVIFASPDKCALISVSSAPMDAPQPSSCADAGASFRYDSRTLTVGSRMVYASLVATDSTWTSAQATFDQVAASVEAGGATG